MNVAEDQQRQAEVSARKAAEEQRRAATVVAAPRAKKVKSLDELFAPDYHVEKMARQPILNYHQVEEQFGIRISGFGRGINPTDSSWLIRKVSVYNSAICATRETPKISRITRPTRMVEPL